MKRSTWLAVQIVALSVFLSRLVVGAEAVEEVWPPPLVGAENGTVTLKTDLFLKVPEQVEAARHKEGAVPFTVAQTPPTVRLAFHGRLPNLALNGTGWTSWGDICVASDGRVYCGIGDHGDDAGGHGYCFIYAWDPEAKVLEQVVDMNKVVKPQEGQPAWTKVHARIDEGRDGKIYFSCTLNDGNSAKYPRFHWTEELPGGQLYQFDPRTGQAVVFANLPPKRCTATSILDRKRNIWWCNLEAGGNALWALDLDTKEVLFKAPDGSMGMNRNFALAADGSIYFNGKDGIWKYDPKKNDIARTGSAVPNSPGMRSSTRESKDGYIYGMTMGTNEVFRYAPAEDELELLGTNFLTGGYTTVCVLSPDERFLYYLPGAHGGALRMGTPVVQYEIATGQRKVIAFMAEAFEVHHDYLPGGTYGVKTNADGSILYVNFNGHAGEDIRPEGMSAGGFGLSAFAAIHIPASER